MKNLMAMFALGFAMAGCGVAPEDEPLPISSMEAALANNGGYTTTRDLCKACGCVASDVACDCGTPPRPQKLDCIDNGGPVNKVLADGIATSPGRSVAATSEPAQPELMRINPTPSPYCLPGEVKHCTLGPPPVCTCIPATVGGFAP
jgi:hypothetical protein